jgi:hypothetical protein
MFFIFPIPGRYSLFWKLYYSPDVLEAMRYVRRGTSITTHMVEDNTNAASRTVLKILSYALSQYYYSGGQTFSGEMLQAIVLWYLILK